jgi:hypothetical protein
VAEAQIARRWPTVLVFNLLEHVFDPITVLHHSLSLVEPGGTCLVVGPVIWPLHDYPADYWQPLPDFFIEFARREGAEVVDQMVDGQKQVPDESSNSRVVWGLAKQRGRGFCTRVSTPLVGTHPSPRPA